MQISPWAAIALNALYAVLTGLTVPLVDAMGFHGYDARIVAWAGVLAVPLNMILPRISSTHAWARLRHHDPPMVVAATAVANLPPNLPETSPRVIVAKAIATKAIADHEP